MNDTDTISARVWLHMLTEGGRWTVAELAAFADSDSRRMGTRLSSMVKSGFVNSYRGVQRSNGKLYGVHVACRIPPTVTLNQIVGAMAPMAEETETA